MLNLTDAEVADARALYDEMAARADAAIEDLISGSGEFRPTSLDEATYDARG